jgi:hypothetical protein
MNKQYQFVTIVATPEVRAQFTELREKLNATDKLLMQAVWNLVNGLQNENAIEEEVMRLKEGVAIERAEKKELKAAAKRKEKPEKEKKAAKKTAKKVAKKAGSTKPVKAKVVNVDEDDDIPCVVVDGTL